jgi:hypothetical protein
MSKILQSSCVVGEQNIAITIMFIMTRDANILSFSRGYVRNKRSL